MIKGRWKIASNALTFSSFPWSEVFEKLRRVQFYCCWLFFIFFNVLESHSLVKEVKVPGQKFNLVSRWEKWRNPGQTTSSLIRTTSALDLDWSFLIQTSFRMFFKREKVGVLSLEKSKDKIEDATSTFFIVSDFFSNSKIFLFYFQKRSKSSFNQRVSIEITSRCCLKNSEIHFRIQCWIFEDFWTRMIQIWILNWFCLLKIDFSARFLR